MVSASYDEERQSWALADWTTLGAEEVVDLASLFTTALDQANVATHQNVALPGLGAVATHYAAETNRVIAIQLVTVTLPAGPGDKPKIKFIQPIRIRKRGLNSDPEPVPPAPLFPTVLNQWIHVGERGADVTVPFDAKHSGLTAVWMIPGVYLQITNQLNTNSLEPKFPVPANLPPLPSPLLLYLLDGNENPVTPKYPAQSSSAAYFVGY